MNKKEYKNKSVSKRNGFSLVELMAALGIGTIVSAGIAAVFIFSIEQFTILVEQNAAEESLLWSAYYTRNVFGQSVDVVARNAPLTNPIVGQGEILTSFSAANDGQVNTIAVFSRETSTTSTGSSIYTTGVFFVNPNNAVPVGSTRPPWGGVLIFNLGNQDNTPLWPGLGETWFDRIIDFQLQNMECAIPGAVGAACNGSNAKSAQFVITARYFKNARKGEWFFFTNPAAAPGSFAPYRDISMTIKVGFRNNVLLNAAASKVGSTVDERLYGGLYFFNMLLPPLRM